jgi:purine-binding chemotaxis protein CheW
VIVAAAVIKITTMDITIITIIITTNTTRINKIVQNYHCKLYMKWYNIVNRMMRGLTNMAELQLVVFKLDKEEYGVDIMQVQEISPYQKLTKVPNSPAFVDGIVNLRGDVIPVVSLKKKFNLIETEVTELTRLIVINNGNRRTGFVVDDASEVITISDKDIEEAPPMIVGADRKYIQGVGKVDKRILIVLNLHKLLTEEEENQLSDI